MSNHKIAPEIWHAYEALKKTSPDEVTRLINEEGCTVSQVVERLKGATDFGWGKITARINANFDAVRNGRAE